jgi:O-acetyl-ADP-ribose deacetylase (regulator of RNase III)
MGEIRQMRGNIFSTSANVLVNTVNCVGVMGAGLALECRYRHPQMFAEYRRLCESRRLTPGVLQLWKFSRPWVLNFPTKGHWRLPSRLEYVTAGLDAFERLCAEESIESIAFPRLGTAHGGLEWAQVEPLMRNCFNRISGVVFEIWEFDPHADDGSFGRLRHLASRLGRTEFTRTVGLRSPQSDLVWKAVSEGEVGSLLALQQAPGVGPKSVERIYKLLFGASKPDLESERSLFEGD